MSTLLYLLWNWSEKMPLLPISSLPGNHWMAMCAVYEPACLLTRSFATTLRLFYSFSTYYICRYMIIARTHYVVYVEVCTHIIRFAVCNAFIIEHTIIIMLVAIVFEHRTMSPRLYQHSLSRARAYGVDRNTNENTSIDEVSSCCCCCDFFFRVRFFFFVSVSFPNTIGTGFDRLSSI